MSKGLSIEDMTNYCRIFAAKHFDAWEIEHPVREIINSQKLVLRDKSLLAQKWEGSFFRKILN